MSTLTVPNAVEAKATISGVIGTLPLGPLTDERREQIANNCVGPLVLLIEAIHLAEAAGPEEEAVLIQFIRALSAQSDLVRRECYFSNLLSKLRACKDCGHGHGQH